MGKAKKQNDPSCRNYHSPLSISYDYIQEWKNSIKEPFLSYLLSICDAEDFKGQIRLIKSLSLFLKKQTNYSDISDQIYLLFNGLFNLIKYACDQDKPTHLPAEFYGILRSLLSSIPFNIANNFIEIFYNDMLLSLEKNNNSFMNLQILDLLLHHKIWKFDYDIHFNYNLLINSSSSILYSLYYPLYNAKNITEQNILLQNSLKIEYVLQILSRMIIIYKNQLSNDILNLINIFIKSKDKQIVTKHNLDFCKLLLSQISILSLDNIRQESITHAGLFLCQILSFIAESNTTVLLNQIFSCFFANISTNYKEYSNFINFLIVQYNNNTNNDSIISNFTFNSLPEQSKLSIYRGLCISMPGHILTQSTSIVLLNNSLDSCVLLFNAIFPAILDISITLTVPLRKLVAFQSIKNACLKIKSLATVKNNENEINNECNITKTLLGVSSSFLFYEFFPKLIDILWRTWEYHYDPVIQQLQTCFECIIDIQQHILRISKNIDECKEANLFMDNLIKDMLKTQWNKKGKYGIFTTIFRAVGSKYVLTLTNTFLNELFTIFEEVRLGGRASLLLSSFITNWNGFQNISEIERNKPKKANKKQKQTGIVPLDIILDSFISNLCSNNSNLQYGMITYAIPIIIQTYPLSIKQILVSIYNYKSSNNNEIHIIKSNQMIALLSVIKNCRKEGILTSQQFQELILSSPEIPFKQILYIGITSGHSLLRHTTLESICETRAHSEPLSIIEKELLEIYIQYCMRDSLGTQGKHEVGILLQKLMIRYKSNLRQDILSIRHENLTVELDKQLNNNKEFLNKITNQIGICFYPCAPFGKRSLGILLYNFLILDIWNYNPPKKKQTERISRKPSKLGVNPIDFIEKEDLDKLTIFSSHNIENLLSGVWNSFEKTRDLVFETIRKFPTPIPNITFEEYRYYLLSAFSLITSSRERNGEIGAMLIRICYFQYLKNYSSPISDSFYIILNIPNNIIESKLELIFSIKQYGPIIRLFTELLYLLEDKLDNIKLDDTLDSHKSIHGILTTIQYLISDIRFSSQTYNNTISIWRQIFTRLLKDLFILLSLAMNIIADMTTEGWTPSLPLLENTNDDNNNDNITNDYDIEDNDIESQDNGRNVIVASWLIIKSVALLLGPMIQNLPLQTQEIKDKYLLSNTQVKESAEGLLRVLLSTRHKGVLEKTYTGFDDICQSIFKSQIPCLLQLIDTWFDHLFKRITNITSSIITRRSAGIPYAVCAILRGEARESHNIKPYLTKVMNFLLDIISNQDNIKYDEMSIVHSFNVLRSILSDKILGTRLDTWIAKYFELTINSLSNSSWAIRNAASLSFSVLIRRTLGVAKKNIEERSKVTTTTFSVLFSRLAPMYPYLLDKFSQLVQQIKDKSTQLEIQTITQTSLYSLLVLLSRLSPSEHILSSSIIYDSTPFIPLVLECSNHNDFRIRDMSARSLVPLISLNNIVSFISSRLELLPQSDNYILIQKKPFNHNSIHGILLQVYYIFKENQDRLRILSNINKDINEYILYKLSKLFWIIYNTSLLVSHSFLNFLYLIINFCKLNNIQSHIFNILYEKTLLISNDIYIQVNNRNILQPMLITWKKTIMYFLCKQSLEYSDSYINITNKTLSNVLIYFINDKDYEIKIEILKTILHILNNKSLSSLSINWNDIQESLLTLLHSNNNLNENTIASLLKVIQKIPLSLPKYCFSLQSNYHWKTIKDLISSSSSYIIHQHCIEYLGYFIYEQLSFGIDSHESFSIWIKQLEYYITSNQPIDFRISVMYSILNSKLLSLNIIKRKEYNNSIVHCWILLSILLEDDDEDIRNTVLEYISLNTNLSLYSPIKIDNNNINMEILLSSYIAKESIFLLLSSKYYNNEYYHTYLYNNCILNIINTNIPLWEANNKELFTKESDNIWEEKLFTTHITCYCLMKLIQNNTLTYNYIYKNNIFLKGIKQLEKLSNTIYKFSNEDIIPSIIPSVDENIFLYTNKLLISLYCLSILKYNNKNSNIIDDITNIFSKSIKQLEKSIISPIIKHILYYLIEQFNKNILSKQIDNNFKPIYGIKILYTISFIDY